MEAPSLGLAKSVYYQELLRAVRLILEERGKT